MAAGGDTTGAADKGEGVDLGTGAAAVVDGASVEEAAAVELVCIICVVVIGVDGGCAGGVVVVPVTTS